MDNRKDHIKFIKWYESQYKKIIGIDSLQLYGEKHNNKDILQLVQEFRIILSNIWQFNKFTELKYLLPVKRKLHSVTTLKIRRYHKNPDLYFEVNYAIIYGIDSPEYITLSPSLSSADGEFRSIFLHIKQISAWYHTSGRSYLNDLEKHILKQIKNKEIELIATGAFTKYVLNNRILIIIYLSVWLVQYSDMVNNLSPNHIHPYYHLCMFDESQHKFFLQLIDGDTDCAFTKHKFLNKYLQDIKGECTVFAITQCGQKLIPLTINTLQNTNNILLPLWRELYISRIVNSIIINGITNGLPLFHDWFYMKTEDHNRTVNLFDNFIMKQKIEHSHICKDIIKQIESQRKYLYVYNDDDDSEIYLSYKLEEFGNKIEVSLDYAEREIVLSEYTICILSEFIGYTFADTPKLNEDVRYNNHLGNLYADFDSFDYFVFGYIYNLWVLNYRCDIIHGDLHLNNIVINPEFGESHVLKAKKKVHCIVYDVQGDKYLFIKPFTHAGIIDFSRSFIWSDVLSESFDELMIEQIKHQHIVRLTNILNNKFPEFYKEHQYDIARVISANFETVYHICEAIDPYTLFFNMRQYIDINVLQDERRMAKFGNKSMLEMQAFPLLESITEQCTTYIITNFIKLFDDISYTIEINNRINLILLQTFNHRLINNVLIDDIILTDYFSDSREMTYSTDTYDEYPPINQMETAIKFKRTSGVTYYKYKLEHDKYLAEGDINADINILAEELQNNKDERRGIHKYDQDKKMTDAEKKAKIKEIKIVSNPLLSDHINV